MKNFDLNKFADQFSGIPGILGREKYFNSSVLVPFIKIEDEYHLLFEKRANNIRQGSEICFPGGGFDNKHDIDFKDTAVRETCEELGIREDQITVLKQLDTLVGPQGVIVESFLGELPKDILEKLKIDKSEVEEIFTIPFSYFVNTPPEFYKVRLEAKSKYIDDSGREIVLLPSEELKLPEMYKNSWGFRNRRVIVYRTSPAVIWGLTAEIIYGLVSKFKENGSPETI